MFDPSVQTGKTASAAAETESPLAVSAHAKGVDELAGVAGEMSVPDEALARGDDLGCLLDKALGPGPSVQELDARFAEFLAMTRE